VGQVGRDESGWTAAAAAAEVGIGSDGFGIGWAGAKLNGMG